ncbi:hypothetical protein QCA50_002075 [Cerrena zonata]|uniref:DUF423-domain-containing protein n=1 Tax=Cerrena zonata TaxID=2478898 RepID=A0AAW0GX88_9APHY
MSQPTSSTPLIHSVSRAFQGRPLLWRSGAILAALGMAAGAFGSHGLRKRPGMTPDTIHAWETASHYAIFNGLALLLVSLHPRFAAHRFAGPAIGLGGAIFSASIMTLVLARDRFRWMGPITPIGGSIMIAG